MATANKNLSTYDLSEIPDASEMVFAIVVAEWNTEITSNLLKGAKETLLTCGAKKESIKIIEVPGSFELPLGAQLALENNPALSAVICLGSVIQGETKHFDFVCASTSQGIMDVGLKYNKPVIFGVLTDNNMDQAISRSGGKLGNKGTEAAITAIKMTALRKKMT